MRELTKPFHFKNRNKSTPSPIIDLIGSGRIGLLLGGNGYAAKSGDALGQLGAAVLRGGEWQGPISKGHLSLARFDANDVYD